MADIGAAIHDAIGLGLAGARGLAEGLGIVQPAQPQGMFGAPAQAQPTDLSDLNPLQQLSLRFQNAVASSEGRGLAQASGALRQRRAAANQQRLDAFSQGTKLLQDFDAIRDRASPADYERINKLLRKRFGELAGGQPGEADEFYDTFMVGHGLTPAMLELVKSDPGAQQILASGGGIGDLRKYLTTPEKLQAAMAAADKMLLGPARNKLDAIGKSDRPDLRGALQERMKTAGGRPTLQMIRDLAEAGIIPDELLPTANEWAALDRNELELADLNFQANPELLKRRAEGYTDELARAAKAQELSQRHANEMELQELRNAGALAAAKNRPRAGAPTERLQQHQWEAARYGKRMLEANRIFEELEAQGFDRTSLQSSAESLLPNVARSSERQKQEQAERDFVGAILRDESGAMITPSEEVTARKKYFPQYGDSKETVKQKAASRKREVEQMRRQAGRAWDENAGGASGSWESRGAPPAPPAPSAAPVDGAAQGPTADSILQDLRAGKITRDQARVMMQAWKAAEAERRAAEAAAGGQ